MNRLVKKMWVDALRSGEYAQAVDALRDGDKYCVLGVLVDLYLKTTNGNWVLDPRTHRWIPHAYDGAELPGNSNGANLPFPVRVWACLPHNKVILSQEMMGRMMTECDIPDIQQVSPLQSYNDMGASFSALADVIEDNF